MQQTAEGVDILLPERTSEGAAVDAMDAMYVVVYDTVLSKVCGIAGDVWHNTLSHTDGACAWDALRLLVGKNEDDDGTCA